MSTVLHVLVMLTVLGALAFAVTTVVVIRHAIRRLRDLRHALRARMGAVAGPRGPSQPSRRASGVAIASGSSKVRHAADTLLAGAAVQARASLPGPGQEVGQIRRDLRRDLAATARCISAGLAAGRPIHSLETILGRLSECARALEVDLTVIAAEPDRAVRRRLLAAQREPTDLLRRACAQVRRGVMIGGSTTTEPLLSDVVADLNDEVIALELRAQAYHELAGMSRNLVAEDTCEPRR